MAGVPPRKNAIYVFPVSLVSQADTDIFQTAVTLAAGDVTTFQDGVAGGNITALPVEVGVTGVLTTTLTAAEMNADSVAVRFHDAAGDEWQDLLVTIDTSTVVLSDLPTSASAAAASAAAGEILILRGDSMSQTVLALGNITTRAGAKKVWFTVKRQADDADADAILMVTEMEGLVVLNGVDTTVAPIRTAEATLTVDNPALGNITIWVNPTATDELVPSDSLHYDVQWTDATDITTPAMGPAVVAADVTRAVA